MAYYVYLLASRKHGTLYVATAIAREKELKKWRRDWKIRPIEHENPGWVDLYPGISS
jgi:putative endonuclease